MSVFPKDNYAHYGLQKFNDGIRRDFVKMIFLECFKTCQGSVHIIYIECHSKHSFGTMFQVYFLLVSENSFIVRKIKFILWKSFSLNPLLIYWN